MAEAMVANSADIIAIIDQSGRLVSANPATEAVLGWRAADFLGQDLLTLVHPDDLAMVHRTLEEAGARPGSLPEVTYRILAADGSWKTLSSVSTNRLDDPAVRGIVVNARDVSQRARDLDGLVATLIRASEHRDPYTAGHQRSVATMSTRICEALGLPYYEVEGIKLGAELHDLGKIAIPSEILCKPGILSAGEWAIVKEHPETGYEILSASELAQPITDIVLHHHERLDGSGYPHGLRGDEIRIGARIVAVADTIDAICSHRPYRPAPGPGFALEVLRDGRGRLYDPDIVDAAIAVALPGSSSAKPTPEILAI